MIEGRQKGGGKREIERSIIHPLIHLQLPLTVRAEPGPSQEVHHGHNMRGRESQTQGISCSLLDTLIETWIISRGARLPSQALTGEALTVKGWLNPCTTHLLLSVHVTLFQ